MDGTKVHNKKLPEDKPFSIMMPSRVPFLKV